MILPTRLVDLHTHLFNARYVPLASIIANAMKKKESRLANGVAKLLESLTGSSYPEPPRPAVADFASLEAFNNYLLDQLWHVTRFELTVTTGSLDAVSGEATPLVGQLLSSAEFGVLNESELVAIIKELSQINYPAEGWTGELPSEYAKFIAYVELDEPVIFGEFLNWTEKVVKKALHVVTKLIDPEIFDDSENLLSFFLTMLKSEEKILAMLLDGYGSNLPSLQVVHFMMDMQMAYAGHKPPYYPFHPVQVDRMQLMQRAKPARVFGFSAFDPHREDWRRGAEKSLAKGFCGFKFYPAMGYSAMGNKPDIQKRIDAFFDFCIKRDVPIFAHCTPRGFQTLLKQGGNAHPKYWRQVLENPRWSNLRLCFGHAGGGRMVNGVLKSPGWMADSEAEWNDPDNFARIVSEICTTYPNVYCEIGYLTELFQPSKQTIFIANLERAKLNAIEAGRPYHLLDKMAFGTDWHMPQMIDRTRDYFEIFLSILNQEPYCNYLEGFFWETAYRYLKLPS